jgi:cysteinyl-tRNA synthetase
MVDLILVLLKKGVAYRGEDGCIYFSIKKFPAYGKLAGIDVKKLKEGARVKQDEYEKEGVGDFALWKAWDENDGAVFWETPLGKGRPGWHIECSAMSMKQFGPTIDIHTGGIDNKFPHHENEIAQSEAATGKKFVNYWMHCAHLMVNNQKMSKSLRNFYTLRDVLNKGCDASAVRYVLINSSYRQPINFTFESVEDAKKTLAGLNNFVERLRSIKQDLKTDSIDGIVALAKDGFDSSMDNDLNVPEAVKHIFDFVRKVNKLIDENAVGKNSASQAIGFLKKVNSVLAVIDFSEKFFELTDEQRAKIVLRNTARKNKDWKKSDQLRDELKKDGIELKDNKDGSTTVNDSLVV